MERVKFEAKKLGFDVIDIDGVNFQSENIVRILSQKQPFMVILCGHGDKTTIYGHGDKKVIELCIEDEHLENKIVYVLSCKTAESLGKSAINKGCKCYIGWSGSLEFPIRENSSIEDDDFARPCMEALMEIPIRILKGDDVYTAYKKCHDIFDSWIESWRDDTKLNSMAGILEEIKNGLLIDNTSL